MTTTDQSAAALRCMLEARTVAWPQWMRAFEAPDRMVPLTTHPSNFRVVVSGGAGKHSSVIPSWGKTKSITLPIEENA